MKTEMPVARLFGAFFAVALLAGCGTTRTATSPVIRPVAVGYCSTNHAVAIWREAVQEKINAIVGAGITDPEQVRKLVIEQTTTEEANARKSRQALSAAAVSQMSQAAAADLGVDSQLTDFADNQVQEMVRVAADRAFTTWRDKLIEQLTVKALEKK